MALNGVTRWIVRHALPRVGMGWFKKPSESVQEGRRSVEGHSTGRTGVRKQACPASPRLISTLSCNMGNPGPQLYPPGRERRMNRHIPRSAGAQSRARLLRRGWASCFGPQLIGIQCSGRRRALPAGLWMVSPHLRTAPRKPWGRNWNLLGLWHLMGRELVGNGGEEGAGELSGVFSEKRGRQRWMF